MYTYYFIINKRRQFIKVVAESEKIATAAFIHEYPKAWFDIMQIQPEGDHIETIVQRQ